MPTYQYACTNPETKHEFEVVQSFSDAPVSECPQCGAAVRKVYGSVGVVFKGSGFYRTDSRTSGSSKEKVDANGSSSSSSKEGASAPAKDAPSSGTGGSAPAASPSSSPTPSSGSGTKAAN